MTDRMITVNGHTISASIAKKAIRHIMDGLELLNMRTINLSPELDEWIVEALGRRKKNND